MVSTNYHRKVQRLIDLTHAKREVALRHRFVQQTREGAQRQRLAQWASTDDAELIDRLVAAGFDTRNVAALSYAPIFAAAWASGSVTRAEKHVLNSEVFAKEPLGDAPRETLTQWLRRPLSKSLWKLWEDFTLARVSRLSWKQRKRSGLKVLRPATRVALASGGIFDLGDICQSEREVLQRIRAIYQLS